MFYFCLLIECFFSKEAVRVVAYVCIGATLWFLAVVYCVLFLFCCCSAVFITEKLLQCIFFIRSYCNARFSHYTQYSQVRGLTSVQLFTHCTINAQKPVQVHSLPPAPYGDLFDLQCKKIPKEKLNEWGNHTLQPRSDLCTLTHTCTNP